MVQAAKALIVRRIEYKPAERHMGSLVWKQTAQQMLPRLHETSVGRYDSRLAHHNSESGQSVHNAILSSACKVKKPGKFPCRDY